MPAAGERFLRWLPAAAWAVLAVCGLPGQTLSFAVGEWAPYTGEALARHGMAGEIVDAAARAAGLTAEFRFCPWKRAEAAVADGSVFGSFPYAETPGRRERFLFSDPLFTSSFAVLTRGDNSGTKGFVFASVDSFQGYRVGVTSGTDAVRLPLERAGAAVEETPTFGQSLKKLELGRLDFVIDDRAVIVASLQTAGAAGAGPGFVLLDKPFGERTRFRVMVSRKAAGAAALVKKFNGGLATIQADGTYAGILARYGFSPP